MGKIIKLTFLVAVRETYELLANFWGLIFRPYLTLKRIKAKKDLSQTALIFLSLIAPFTLALCFSLIYLALKKWLSISPPSSLVFLLKLADFSSLIFLILGLSYLVFWTHQVLKTNYFYPKGGKNVL